MSEVTTKPSQTTDLGRDMAYGWMQAAIVRAKDDEQALKQMEILVAAAIHVLATIAMNKVLQSKLNRTAALSEIVAVMQLELDMLLANKENMDFVTSCGGDDVVKH